MRGSVSADGAIQSRTARQSLAHTLLFVEPPVLREPREGPAMVKERDRE